MGLAPLSFIPPLPLRQTGDSNTERSRDVQSSSGLQLRRKDPDYKGKGLQIEFTVEDEGAFTMPWSATVTYRRALREMAGNCLC